MKKIIFLTFVISLILQTACRKYEVKIYDSNRIKSVVHYKYLFGEWYFLDSMVYSYDKNKLEKIDMRHYSLYYDSFFYETLNFHYKTSYIEKEHYYTDTVFWEKLYPNDNGMIIKTYFETESNTYTTKYEYDDNNNLIKEIGEGWETRYIYDNSDLKQIEYQNDDIIRLSVKTLPQKSNLNLFHPEYVFFGNTNTNLIDYIYFDTIILQKYEYEFDNENRIIQMDIKDCSTCYTTDTIFEANSIQKTKIYYY